MILNHKFNCNKRYLNLFLLLFLFFNFSVFANVDKVPTAGSNNNVIDFTINYNDPEDYEVMEKNRAIWAETNKKRENAKTIEDTKKLISEAINDENMSPSLKKAILSTLKHDKKEKTKVIVDKIKDEMSVTQMIKQIEIMCKSIGGRLKSPALYLLGILTMLEILFSILANPTEFPVGTVGRCLVTYALLYFLILHFPSICSTLRSMMFSLGGSSLAGNPGELWKKLSSPILDGFNEFDWSWVDIGDSIFNLLLFLLALFPLYFAVYIVVEIFIVNAEFYFITGFAVILIPFYAWNKTRELNRVVSILANQSARLFASSVVLNVFNKTIPDFKGLNIIDVGDFITIASYGIMLFIIRMLIVKTAGMANALITGSSTGQGASEIVGTAGKLTAAAVSVVIAVAGRGIAGAATGFPPASVLGLRMSGKGDKDAGKSVHSAASTLNSSHSESSNTNQKG